MSSVTTYAVVGYVPVSLVESDIQRPNTLSRALRTRNVIDWRDHVKSFRVERNGAIVARLGSGGEVRLEPIYTQSRETW
jgi:hypothetical protein